jgi:uncharacterized protein (TIGR00255 family)
MALISMTGFGRGEASARGVKVEVELSSVNRKQFEVRLSMPRQVQALESRVNSIIHERVARGAVTGTVKISAGASAGGGVRVDVAAAESSLKALRAAGRALGLSDDLTLRTLVALPGVVQYHDVSEETERVWSLLERALARATDGLVAMRRTEGQTLEADIRKRFASLGRQLGVIRKLAPAAQKKYGKALHARLCAASIPLSANDPNLLREIAIWADRSDISEEIVRLDSHLKHVAGMLHEDKPVGRTLDFLCQEMFREINTIGSKANEAAISRQVVHFKTELESIREQVQNVQ